MRALVVTNMYPSERAPQRGRFVYDQVEALRRREDIEVSVFAFAPGRARYSRATQRLRALLGREHFDVVHAHYGLTGWVAKLAGARPLIVTFHGTDVRHPLVGPLSRLLARHVELAAGVSQSLFAPEGGRPGLRWRPGASAVLPCGPDLTRFGPRPRAEARGRLGLDPDGRYLLFPADPKRKAKRHDHAAEVAELAGAELLTAGAIDPEAMPDWYNAAAAVLVPSDHEGFGLAALEALACGVPVLATPVGVAPAVLHDLLGCLVAPYEPLTWASAARRHLDAPDPRVKADERVAEYDADHTAERVAHAYRELAGV